MRFNQNWLHIATKDHQKVPTVTFTIRRLCTVFMEDKLNGKRNTTKECK